MSPFNPIKHFTLSLILSGLIVSAQAQDLGALKTSPAQLNNLSQSQLNAFGLQAANEAYAVLSRGPDQTQQGGHKRGRDTSPSVKNAKALLADKALIQNARSQFGQTKETYSPTRIENYSINSMAITRPADDILVASYDVQLPNRVDLKTGTLLSGQNLPRLSVLRWDETRKHWVIFSHADFDSVQATLCGAATNLKPKAARFLKADNQLARSVLSSHFNAMMNGTLEERRAKGYQFVYASGERQTQEAPVRAKLNHKLNVQRVEAVRDGRLLAVRFDAPAVNSLDGGPINPAVKPRLLTFYKDNTGEWKLISAAIFSVTQKVASTIDCVNLKGQ